MNFESLSPLLYRLSGEEGIFLGLRIGTGAVRSAAQLAAIAHEPSMIIDGKADRFTDWVPSGFVVHQDELILYGPWLPDILAMGLIPQLPRDQAMNAFFDFQEAAILLEKHGRLPESGLYLDAWFRLADGRVLVLAPRIQKLMLSLIRKDERLSAYECFQKAGLESAHRLSFGFDVLAFRIIAGRHPYDDISHADRLGAYQLHGVMRTPRCLSAAVPQAVEDHFRKTFQSSESDGGLATSLKNIRAWWESAAQTQVSSEIDDAALKRFNSKQGSFKRRSFFHRHSWKFGLAAVGLVLAILIGATAISNLLRPLRTMGLAPEKVVLAFYAGMNALDSELVKDCLKGDTGKDMVSLVDNLYVISQVRAGTERRNVRLPAQDWLTAGSPPIDPSLILYGIGSLVVEPSLESVDSGDSRHYVARYDIYSAESSAEEPKDFEAAHLVATVNHRLDRLSLRLGDRGTWQIVAIDREETAPPSRIEIQRP